MKIEFSFLRPDELDVGIHMFYGGDDDGEFHVVIFGFIFCSVSFYKYLNNNGIC